ncbi:hypothetical protein [Streptomyces sp. NPDC006997]|uniref:hypothetical protein n=1 Tax=Streptomyces sp. NPDC006997 TaxID=3155356 RepID=UPI0033E5794C
MTYRGRHRRRRRGRALRAALAGTAFALTAVATLISTSQATVAGDPGALEPLTSAADTGPLRLTEDLVPRRSLDRLTASMGDPVGVGTVLADADHTLGDADECGSGERAALPVEPEATRAYCWSDDDPRAVRAGAVTTSGDADVDGRWGANRVILSGWSRPAGGTERARVAFVDAGDPDRLAYTWALLVVPVDGGRDYRALGSDVSGLVWYEDKLLVTADDGRALYVCDLDRIQRADVDSGAVGRVPGGFAADGDRYVLPAVGSYRLTGDEDAARFAAVSLDRSTAPDSLVASGPVAADDERPTGLWRYSFSGDPARAGLLATTADGTAAVDAAYVTRMTGVRGVLAHRAPGTVRPRWYLARASDGRAGHGSLWRQDTDGTRTARCGADGTYLCWSGSAESLPLSLWEETGEVWSQSGRMLFSLPLSTIDGSLE